MGKSSLINSNGKIVLSLIIPVYNGHEHVVSFQRTIKGISKESSIQIVVVDDASTDGTSDSLLEVLETSGLNFILEILEKNAGPGGARNIGLNGAVGRYVAFVDFDDDFSVNGYLSLSSKLEESGSSVGIARYEAILCNQKDVGTKKYQVSPVLDTGSRVLSQLVDRVAPWRYVYEREWLLKHDLNFPESKPGGGEDLLFLLQVDQANPKVVVTEDTIYKYFLGHNGQMSTSKFDSEPRIFLLQQLAYEAVRYQRDWEKVIIAEWFLRTWLTWIRNPSGRRQWTSVRYLRMWWAAGNSGRTLMRGLFLAFHQHRRWKNAWITRASNSHENSNQHG